MNYIIIGAGAAGIEAGKMLRKMDPYGKITMISVDKDVHSRCMLHKYLSLERDEKGISFVPDNYFEENKIRWVKDEPVTSIDTEKKEVYMESGAFLPYDKLLITTGSVYGIPPIPNFRTADNVYGFRDLSDAQLINNAVLERGKNVFIVGSGLVGLDVAYGLLERGCKVTVAEMANRIMPLQTDEISAKRYQELFEKEGCTFKLGIGASDSIINEQNEIITVKLSNGEEISCDFVVVAAGVRPNIAFLERSSIKIDRGITVNNYLQTSDPDVFAAGDVTGLAGIWPNAMDQGRIAAMNMSGAQVEYEDTFAIKNTCNFFGVPMLSVGDVEAKDDTYEVIISHSQGIYKKAIVKDHTLVGLQLQGNIDNSGIWQYLIKHKVKIDHVTKDIFNLSFADFYGIDPGTGEFEYQ